MSKASSLQKEDVVRGEDDDPDLASARRRLEVLVGVDPPGHVPYSHLGRVVKLVAKAVAAEAKAANKGADQSRQSG